MKNCKYCRQPLQEVDCAKCNKVIGDLGLSIHEVITFIYWVISLFIGSYKDKLIKHKYKTTCVNKDCINYLKGCWVNKHLYTFSLFGSNSDDKCKKSS